MPKLETISCEEIMLNPLKPVPFFVDGLITQGLFILAGAPKIGKSWLALDICLSVARGEPVLSCSTVQGTALYLCLEDSKVRIQNRLYEMTDEPAEELHFALLANTIGGGLEQQVENFITEHTSTKIVIIDTLQKIRSQLDQSYAADYQELSVLKQLAEKYSVAIILVHHLRKTRDSDPFNMISGTTGLSGCVDGSFVLAELQRGSRTATLYCVGRDIENREIELKFDKNAHRWIADEPAKPKVDKVKIFVEMIFEFMKEKISFNGTATELAELLKPYSKNEIYPNRLTRDLVQNAYALKNFGIEISTSRSNKQRTISIKKIGDGSDGKNLPPKFTVLLSPDLDKTFDNTGSGGDGRNTGDGNLALSEGCPPI